MTHQILPHAISLINTCYDLFVPKEATEVNSVVELTPKFQGYGFGKNPSIHLTDLSVRPANLFFEALFSNAQSTTLPGKGLFRFTASNEDIHRNLIGRADGEEISFSATTKKADLYAPQYFGNTVKVVKKSTVDLSDYLGTNTFSISIGEIKKLLESQKVYISPLIPKRFYIEMKTALKRDAIVLLPGHEKNIYTMKRLLTDSSQYPHLQKFLCSVSENPARYGFIDNGTMFSFEKIMNLTLYQVGSLIIKSEDYYPLAGNGYEINHRQVGDQTALNLISASGIRAFYATTKVLGNKNHEIDQVIMKNVFKTALYAAEKGDVVFPAVGMGVWGGDPDIYWRAFLDAIIEADTNVEKIYINPGHQKTWSGVYKGCNGSEFQQILGEYKQKYPDNDHLLKIVNLFEKGTDLLLLAQNLKKENPQKRVSLFNASDPDVTLGNHVGEYVNNLCEASTTEENFAAAGTSGLGFEGISKVLEHDERIIQVQ